MNNGSNAAREGLAELLDRVEYLDYGHHKHAYILDDTKQAVFIGTVEGDKVFASRLGVESACGICGAENDAFLELQRMMGSEPLEERMHSLISYRAYNQRWPFDAREKVLSVEAVFEERADGNSSEPADSTKSVLERLMDEEATDTILSVLTDEQRLVIERTVQGYKPREIAELKGDKSSDRVRQDKYSAMRALGAPINSKMRRGKK